MRILSVVTLSVLCLAGGGEAAWAKPQEPAAPLAPEPVCHDYLAARFAAAHHDLVQASRLFEQCLSRASDNPQLLASAFFYATASGDVKEGARLATRLLAVQPGQRMAHLTLAVEAIRAHDYAAAHEHIAVANKDILAAYSVRLLDTWVSVGEGKGDAAEKALQAMHKPTGSDGAIGFSEALLADYLGNKARAQAAYSKALSVAGPSPRLVDAYGRFLERNDEPEQARALYDSVKADAGVQPIALAGLARLATGVKPAPLISRPEEGAAEALLGIASILSDESNADVSILFLQLAKYLRPDFELADLLIADRFESVGALEPAVAIYSAFPKASPYYRMAAIQGATNKLQLKRADDALADIRALSEAFPHDLDVWVTYGDFSRQLKRNDEAVKNYTQAITLVGTPVKKHWLLYYARATVEESAGNWVAAEADLKKALQLNPDEPQVLNFLGYGWVDRHENLKEAVAMLEKANKLAPDNGFITDSVGWAYYRLGRYGEAAGKLERAVQLEPNDATINDHLGDAYWKVGRKLEAGFQWKHALAFGTEEAEKAKIAKKLEGVSGGE